MTNGPANLNGFPFEVMGESNDLWVGGGLLLTAGVFGFLNYKNAMEKRELIEKLAAAAQDTAHESGIPISYIVAQATHESNYGRSGLATRSNNLFGIKAQTGYAGNFDEYTTNEFVAGKMVQVKARFRKYTSWEDSVRDWYKFIQGARYSKALAAARVHDSKGFFSELQKAGYATDPNYANLLVNTLNSLGDIA